MMVALEWDAQLDNRRGIETSSMPLMKIVSTAIDQVMIDKSSTVATCLSYIATDTILFQAHPEERALRRQQQMNFQPILRWLKDTFSLQLKPTEDLHGKIPHSSSVTERLSIIINSLVSHEIQVIHKLSLLLVKQLPALTNYRNHSDTIFISRSKYLAFSSIRIVFIFSILAGYRLDIRE